ncbi:ovalbumin-related protein X [Dermacentor silvarum]|uniref:ovalbumin-related protein X n=1 Tax=Dermacentor silvarum TaxID=543639 RepID=UPI00189A8489|nr:ovalbumin-related protein X [Dermacentor silvarum]
MAGPLLQFPLDMYQRMRQQGGNVLLSPWYLACMLVTMYHGSGGSTRSQIARVLRTDDDGEIVERFNSHASRLFFRDYPKPRHTHSGLRVTYYAGLYHDARVNLSKEFKEPLSNLDIHFHVHDFAESPEQSRLSLDGFLRALTGFCFERDVFSGDSVDLDTFVVLASVFTFGSRWFAAGGARRSTGRFHPEYAGDKRDGEEVPTLSMTGTFRYAKFGKGDAFAGVVVDLPYQEPRWSLAIFLPAPDSSLVELEKALTAATILTCLGRLVQHGPVTVTLPRMKVKCLTDLKQYLQPMGVTDAFNGTADFVNIARIVGLRVSAAKQLAVFRAGHRGPKIPTAEAVAEKAACAASGKSVFKITVDRPFMFLVLARDPDTVFMLGSFTHTL